MPAPDQQKSSASSPLLHGIDFTSAPRSRKGITIASGTLERDTFRLQGLLTLTDFPAFVRWLDQPGPCARSVLDTALLHAAIAGHDPHDSTSINAPVPDVVARLQLVFFGAPSPV